MKELMIMAANLMPENILLDELEKAITVYRAVPTESNRSTLAMFSMMITTRLGNNNTPEELISELARMDRTKDLLNPHKG